MLRLIRVAAIAGMTLALVDFCWTAAEAPKHYDLFQFGSWHDMKQHWHHALKVQYQSGVDFTFSAILYVLVDIATRERSERGPADKAL